MRIAVVGSGGQVAAEVVCMLARVPEVDLVPIVRTRSGSAFLRYQGIPVVHADVTDRSITPRCLADVGVVANFALAGGTPSDARRQNERLIRATFQHSDESATIVFFSTLAVRGEFDMAGRRHRTAYGALKLRNEKLVASLAKKHQRPTFILRLGHVAGRYQALTQLCRDEILSPPITLPNLDLLSNVTHTVTIADALLAIGSARAGPPGLYDLVNVPQWTWRAVYQKEAADLGVLLAIADSVDEPPAAFRSRFTRAVLKAIGGKATKESLLRLMADMPGSFNERFRAEYQVERARGDIAALYRPPEVRNRAALWPEFEIRTLAGLTRTALLLASNAFSGDQTSVTRWPPDLAVGDEEPVQARTP